MHMESVQEGGYVASVPALPGCYTQGDTYEEALANAREAIELYLESLIADKEEVPIERNNATVSLHVHIPAAA